MSMMRHVLLSLLALVGIVHGQNPTTPIPPSITVQPTDWVTQSGTSRGIIFVPLATKGFAIEYDVDNTDTTTNQYISLPCQASANPQRVTYTWYKYDTTSATWNLLTKSEKITWNEKGDTSNAGMLTIKPFLKTADAGSYVCWATSDYATAVSKAVNLEAVFFVGQGQQAPVATVTKVAGSYFKLDAPAVNSFPNVNASWTRTSSSSVPSGSDGVEIPPDRTYMDETGALHIGYLDDTLLKVATSSGTSSYNFFHYKTLSLRYMLTDLANYQISSSGTAPTSAQCVLQYQTPQLNLLHGQNSRIVCVYSGAPSIKVNYKKKDANGVFQPLTVQVIANSDANKAISMTGLYGNTYMIGLAKTTDAGVYSCEASYSGGSCQGVASQITVNVDLEPTFVAQPNPIVYVVEGQQITLEWRVKGRPKPTIAIYQNGLTTLPVDPNKILSKEQDSLVDPVDGYPIYLRSFTLMKAIKPTDSRSIQIYATNKYYQAISSVALTVISPITFPVKMPDQLALAQGASATFVCTVYGDDALALSITWSRFLNGLTYPISVNAQFDIATNDAVAPSGLRALVQTLTVKTDVSIAGSLDGSRGVYTCMASNNVTSGVTSGRLSFVGDDPVSASFEMWMLGPILGGVAAILLVVGIILIVRRNRGEKYEVEDEEIKKGYDPKKEAHEQRELREYQRDREKDSNEPLRQNDLETGIDHDEDV